MISRSVLYPNTSKQNKYSAYSNNNSFNTIQFGSAAQLSGKTRQVMEICARKVEFSGRTLLNKLTGLFNGKQINKMYEDLAGIEESSPEYTESLVKAGKIFGLNKEVEINLESNRITELASAKDACIFIINHDSQKHDPSMLGVFGAFLYNEYIRIGKAKACPKPKIILNEDILLSMNKKLRTVFEKFGAIGVDASFYPTQKGKKQNADKLLEIGAGFIADKVNLFIFPEGKMSAFQKLDLKDRFQQGIAKMVNKVIQHKDSVKVVPIGFAYNKNSKPLLSSIHIGRPVHFTKENGAVLVSTGNMTPDQAPLPYRRFFYGNESSTSIKNGREIGDIKYKAITDKGIPVTGKDLPTYIGDILCENLRICRNEAKKSVPASTLGDRAIAL